MSSDQIKCDPDSKEGLLGRIEAFKARAQCALRMNSSENVRMKRYRMNMDKATFLEIQLKDLLASEARHD